jgi:hypothetical protein
MEARKKAGANAVLPRDRVADITVIPPKATESSDEKETEPALTQHSPEQSPQSSVQLGKDVTEKDEDKRLSIRKKPVIGPKPSGESFRDRERLKVCWRKSI